MSEKWSKSKAVDQRVEALLDRMTLDDKINLVSGQLVVDDSGHCPHLPDGLPELRLADGPAGLRVAGSQTNNIKSTALPAPIALAATWEPELARQYGDLLGQEAAATGHNVLLGPAVDIARAPMGGRTFEYFGEDPLLQSRMVVPEIAAIQSHAVAACIKHYLVNNQEFKRNQIDVQVDERTLREIYLPPFVAAIQGGQIASAMGSYNRINGIYACENPFTLTKILRQELGFRGFVMSDFMATMSAAPSAQAGLEWELGTKMWGPALQMAVESGELSLELLDEMVRRILRPILGLGLADRPRQSGTIDIAAHSALAREVAEQGIVLLKNNTGLLPIAAEKIHSIAVIGADADNVSAAGGGSAFVRPAQAVSVLDGIRQRVGEAVRVAYASGTDPVGPGALLPGLAAIPSDFFPDGLRVEYWDNPDFSGEPLVTRTEPRIEFNYGFMDFFAGSLAGSSKLLFKPAVLSGRIAARVAGQLEIPATGNLQMTLTCLGMARLYLDERLVLDTATGAPDARPGNNSQASVYSVQVSITPAQTCAIRLEYSNFAVDGLLFNEAMLRLGWQLPAGQRSAAIQQAAVLAGKSDLAIVVARTYETEEIDRPDMELPNGQADLIRAVAAANPNTIVVLMNAGPVEVASWEAAVPAILEAWYAGQEQGSALARVLFGDVNPSGRLPLTFPRSLAQTPVSTPSQYPGVEDKVHYSEGLFVGYRGYDKYEIEPQYPFGYGLSYTTFEYANLQLNATLTDGTQSIRISFEISNTGRREGVDVAQVYLGLPVSVSGPLKRLAGWARVALQPGESKQVTIVLEPNSSEHPLSFWSVDRQAWEIATGEYQVYLGASARDIRLTAHSKFKNDQEKTMLNSFKPGQKWLDTNSKPIQAHGGSVLFHEGTFYWYGENKENTTVETGLWHSGVRCYSSQDLYNWKDEGVILAAVEDDPRSPLHPKRIMDRPHILYHKGNRQFVMWAKFAGTDENPDDWSTQYMGIAVSEKITGPFRLLHTVKPLGMNTGDFDLYADPTDGKAYIIFGRVHTEIVIADLTEDYLNVNGYYSAHFPRSGPPFGREAPALFRHEGRFYILTSGTTGYNSNPSEAATAQLIHGPWTEFGDACAGDTQRNSFDSQFSSVFQHPFKKDLYIALGDRWMDGAPKEKVEGLKWNSALSTYTWLPIRFDGERPLVEWRDEWLVEDYEDKPTEIPWWAKPIGG